MHLAKSLAYGPLSIMPAESEEILFPAFYAAETSCLSSSPSPPPFPFSLQTLLSKAPWANRHLQGPPCYFPLSQRGLGYPLGLPDLLGALRVGMSVCRTL